MHLLSVILHYRIVGRGANLSSPDNAARDSIGERIKQISNKYQMYSLEIAVGGFPTLTSLLQDATYMAVQQAGRTLLHIAHNHAVTHVGVLKDTTYAT